MCVHVCTRMCSMGCVHMHVYYGCDVFVFYRYVCMRSYVCSMGHVHINMFCGCMHARTHVCSMGVCTCVRSVRVCMHVCRHWWEGVPTGVSIIQGPTALTPEAAWVRPAQRSALGSAPCPVLSSWFSATCKFTLQ